MTDQSANAGAAGAAGSGGQPSASADNEPVHNMVKKPEVLPLRPSVIGEVLKAGVRDFARAPLFGVFFGVLYAIGGWAIFYFAFTSGYFFLCYPLAAGFALIAPFVAAGLYEVSRELEQGRRPSWAKVLSVILPSNTRDLGWMALVTGFAFFIWLDIAFFLYAMFFGLTAPDPWGLMSDITGTANGALFFLVGNVTGALIAFFVFSITVVSFPLLLDRNVDFVTAMIVSVNCVRENPRTMVLWAITIGVLVLVSLATALAGLVIVLPVLGHATWHMYRRAIAPENDGN